jgi:hypothetical protein
VTVSVTAMLTTAGITRLTSGAKLSGAERATANPGAPAVQALTNSVRTAMTDERRIQRLMIMRELRTDERTTWHSRAVATSKGLACNN